MVSVSLPWVRRLLFLVALLGILDSAYLWFTYVTGAPIVCSADGGCDIVRASSYAAIMGISTPVYGLLFYVLLAVGAILLTPTWANRVRFPLIFLTGVGVVVSGALTYIEAFVIDAWCVWCVVSAVLSVVAFGIVWLTRWRVVG